jgi:S-DNA-T family DNA segregation ATPase FtsK/SpoIIIE
MAEKIGDQREEFLSSLISVAQRGRTLGVHMILAAQRPSGVVNDKIRANTNLRIALRVQDAEDSLDVIGQGDAARLSREHPGRAYVRLGPGEVVAIQTALVTTVSGETAEAPVEVAPFRFGPPEPSPPVRDQTQQAPDRQEEAQTDLQLLVEAVLEANRAEGIGAPRRLWPDPLPEQLDLAQFTRERSDPERVGAVVALADDPSRQAQYPVGWQLAEGNLLLLGVPGSGTTTALISVGLSLAGTLSPEELELYGFDFGAGDLAVLERLPHTGSVVPAGDRERQMRLVRHLGSELARRRSRERGSSTRRRTVVLLDNLAAMRSEFDDVDGLELMDLLGRVYASGPEVGICFAVAADRWNAVPTAWTAVTTQRWLFRLGDEYDYLAAGLGRTELPADLPGRAVQAPNGLPIQVAKAMPSTAEVADAIAARHAQSPRSAVPIRALPAEVSFGSLGAVAEPAEEPWRVPFGVRESDLGVAGLVLYEGEHALVAGPARSGKSTTLLTLAESLRAGQRGGGLYLAGTGGRRSPLRGCPHLDRFAAGNGESTALFAHLHTVAGPAVLFVDDAEGFEDLDEAIAGLLGANLADLHVIAAGNADSLRSLYGHWTQTVRKSKVGVLLRPDVDYDGDLLGVTLPRRPPVSMPPGRGYLAQNGECQVVHVALPSG